PRRLGSVRSRRLRHAGPQCDLRDAIARPGIALAEAGTPADLGGCELSACSPYCRRLSGVVDRSPCRRRRAQDDALRHLAYRPGGIAAGSVDSAPPTGWRPPEVTQLPSPGTSEGAASLPAIRVLCPTSPGWRPLYQAGSVAEIVQGGCIASV